MSGQSLTLGEYLDHLRKQRDKLDDLISTIEKTLEGLETVSFPMVAVPSPSAPAAPRKARGPYSAMTIIDAAMSYLREVGKPVATADLVKALQNGGLKSSSASPYRTLYNTLNNRLEKGIFKSGNKWGLSEWQRQADLLEQK
jgi:hypothetical protein